MTVGGRVLVALAALAVTMTPGCALNLEGLAFKVDDRLRFVSPEDREVVTLPVTIDWEISDFEDDGSFAVFIDRAPQPPSQPLDWFGRDDDACRAKDGCPDAKYLADRGVFATDDTRLVIRNLPAQPSDESKRRELHEATVVLLDAEGRRIGESAFTIEFEVRRGQD